MIILLTTCSPEDAERIVRELLEARLVGCGNILPVARSLYWWEGAIEEDAEALVLMETTEMLGERALERLRALHPYDVPKIAVLSPSHTDTAYLEWLGGVTLDT